MPKGLLGNDNKGLLGNGLQNWSDQDEIAYRRWLNQWSQNTGIPYNPDDSTYDYRKAYKLNISPIWQPEHQQYRWSDIGKSPNYKENIDFYESGVYKIWDKLLGGYLG